ncbi:MAG: HAMP domain-containing sensor histidine kinase, partial [Planctomycetota bacterium]
ADSLLVFDESGTRVYPPKTVSRSVESLNQSAWLSAERLEFELGDLGTAGAAYAAIAAVETSPDSEAMAWIAQARCLAKSGKEKAAASMLQQRFADPSLRAAKDETGRSLWLDAQLRAVQLLETLSAKSRNEVGPDASAQRALVRRMVMDYGQAIPASQRLFAMQEFASCFPDAKTFSTQHAEEIAQGYLQVDQDRPDWTRPDQPQRILSGLDPLHSVGMRNTPVVLLMYERDLQKMASNVLSSWKTEDSEVRLMPANASMENVEAKRAIASLPHHVLAIRSLNPNFLSNSSRTQAGTYVLASLFTVALALAVALAFAVYFSRQLQTAQMKTDLAAVVTHELRTPLSSIRLLVDTLLNGTVDDTNQRNEYLNLIARENGRLSRLIDNFLTYSNIERGNQRYAFAATDLGELAARTVATLGGKLSQPGCRFSLDIEEELPIVRVDPDAMENVLVNLIDNALKFSGPEKEIRLSVSANVDSVIYEVADNGVGLSKSDAKHVFDRFYQADSRLARSHDGCGLGLSLVRSIVTAHDGSVQVESLVDHGSKFTVVIPTRHCHQGDSSEELR